jgi:hypothetical protein
MCNMGGPICKLKELQLREAAATDQRQGAGSWRLRHSPADPGVPGGRYAIDVMTLH